MLLGLDRVAMAGNGEEAMYKELYEKLKTEFETLAYITPTSYEIDDEILTEETNIRLFSFCKATSIRIRNLTNGLYQGFSQNTTVRTITLDNYLTGGGINMCNGCTSLTTFTAPNATNLGANCLNSCLSLATVDIHNRNKSEVTGFPWCSSLTAIPDSVRFIFKDGTYDKNGNLVTASDANGGGIS